MPELEREELSLLYQAKGIPTEQAEALATQVMQDPGAGAGGAGAGGAQDRRGDQHADARGLDHRHRDRARRVHPGGAAPVRAPDRGRSGPRSRWRCCRHFGVGAARSFFTGRGVFRSGMDMFLVGLGVAVVGYFVGDWIVKFCRGSGPGPDSCPDPDPLGPLLPVPRRADQASAPRRIATSPRLDPGRDGATSPRSRRTTPAALAAAVERCRVARHRRVPDQQPDPSARHPSRQRLHPATGSTLAARSRERSEGRRAGPCAATSG